MDLSAEYGIKKRCFKSLCLSLYFQSLQFCSVWWCFYFFFLQPWWQPSSLTSVICRVKAGRVTVSWLLLSCSRHHHTSQLLLNMESIRFPPRVSMLLMRAALKATARRRREVELEAEGQIGRPVVPPH